MRQFELFTDEAGEATESQALPAPPSSVAPERDISDAAPPAWPQPGAKAKLVGPQELGDETMGPPPKKPVAPDDSAGTDSRLRLALAEILPAGFLGAFDKAFGAMAIAEEEIELAKKEHPERADEIHQSFRYLRPTEVLERTSDEVYRHHVRELLARVVAGKKLEPGTDAELVAAMSGITQAAPPTRALTLLYMKLFRGLYPEKAAEFFEGITPDLYEEERMRELESELRRKLSAERDCHKA